jgi:hypothetical protein
MRPETLCGLLAEPERLRSYAAVALGAATSGEVADRTGLPPRTVAAALRRLEQGGLVTSDDGGALVADLTAFKDAVRTYAPKPADEPLDVDRQRAAVLRSFLVDGRIVRMPAARGKRRIVLEHVVTGFTPGVRYPEREVDAVLRAWHDDYVTLRRYLIDEELMSRDQGVYWRTGGYLEVGDPS